MSSELDNSGLRVAVGDCSITEHQRWGPPYQTGMCSQNTTNTARMDARHRVCAAMVPTAEPLGECRYENWNTHAVNLLKYSYYVDDREAVYFIFEMDT